LKRAFVYIILLCALLLPKPSGFAQKTDTIYHVNGNILTGDFKNLNYGVISWKMDGMGTISLEEIKVNTLTSAKQFRIKMKDELMYFGSFSASEEPRTVYIATVDKKVKVHITDIVEVYPLKTNFWMKTSGTFSFGLNYTKGSNVATVAFSGQWSTKRLRFILQT